MGELKWQQNGPSEFGDQSKLDCHNHFQNALHPIIYMYINTLANYHFCSHFFFPLLTALLLELWCPLADGFSHKVFVLKKALYLIYQISVLSKCHRTSGDCSCSTCSYGQGLTAWKISTDWILPGVFIVYYGSVTNTLCGIMSFFCMPWNLDARMVAFLSELQK